MVIRDKQELKRCIKQAVRRAQVIETDLAFDLEQGRFGVCELLETWAMPSGAPNDVLRRAASQGTPFNEAAVSMFAALNALEMPTHNLNNAQTIQESYDKQAYLREVLDAMRARRVLVRVPASCQNASVFEDDRFAPKIEIDAQFFAPGRYGIDYKHQAETLCQMLEQFCAKDIYAHGVNVGALCYCLIPVSEDAGCVLHLQVDNELDFGAVLGLFDVHPKAKAVISCGSKIDERKLIDFVKNNENVLVSLHSIENMRYALSALGTRFIPYSSHASLPEQMLGRWEIARETIWQTLLEAYLPLARAGYELTSEAIARDVSQLLGGNLESLYSDMN